MKKRLRNRNTGVGVLLGRMVISPELGVVKSRLDGNDRPGYSRTSLQLEDSMVFPPTPETGWKGYDGSSEQGGSDNTRVEEIFTVLESSWRDKIETWKVHSFRKN